MEKQVKSRQRVADHGEVYTAEREVNAMLDLVKRETERVDSRFLEPACGDGKKELSDAEKEYKSKRKMIQEKLIKFATRVPVFMYLTDYREYSLQDVITQLEPELFKKVTGLDVKDFELLVSLSMPEKHASLQCNSLTILEAFRYDGLSMSEIIAHLATFVSRLWQIHVFGEGNTRTTSVFFIKYLRTLGFDVTNDIFAENAWYFRNSLVRANYNDLKHGVHETTEYLELFLRNLLLGERNELHNRYLHISKAIQKQDIGDAKQNIGGEKQDIDGAFPYANVLKAAGASAKTANHVRKMFAEYGFETIFGRNDVTELLSITASPASTLLKKLADMGVTEAVSGLATGLESDNPPHGGRSVFHS